MRLNNCQFPAECCAATDTFLPLAWTVTSPNLLEVTPLCVTGPALRQSPPDCDAPARFLGSRSGANRPNSNFGQVVPNLWKPPKEWGRGTFLRRAAAHPAGSPRPKKQTRLR
eukprot:g42630.t1